MTRVFQAWPRTERAAFDAHYLEHLRARNGLPQLETRTFTIRERLFQELETRPVRRTGPPIVDPEVFADNHLRRVPQPGLDEPTLWALCMAKGNRAERHGIDYKLAKKGYTPGGADSPFVYIEIEETYHTRILYDALRVIGLDVEFTPPRGMTRRLVEFFGLAPHVMTDLVVLDAEVTGVVLFRMMLEKARELFSDQRAPLARIEKLLREIIIDEVGHVHYLISRLGPKRLAVARALLPLIARALLDDIPEFGLLFGRERVVAAILAADLDGAVAEFPERMPAYPPAAQPCA
jgi:hypothetical protein